MSPEAHYRPIVHPIVLGLEIICAAASLFLIAGGLYGVFADFQPSAPYVVSVRGAVALTWLPIGAFILTDVMLFRRNISKMFISRAVLVIMGLFIVTFLGTMMFWFAGLPAWRTIGVGGPQHSYSYTIIDKSRRYDHWICPGRITFNSHIWFKRNVCAPEDVWSAAEIGAGVTLIGPWTPAGVRYTSIELKQ